MQPPQLSKRQLRVGLIGTGALADNHLVPALKAQPDATLWSVLGRDHERTAAFATKHAPGDSIAVHTKLEAFLADPELDAVLIATPDSLHAAQAIASARAGKHIFVEKPMCTEVHDAALLTLECSRSAVKLAVGYHLRHHAGHRQVRELIRSGAIGAIKYMHACWTWKAPEADWRSKQTGSRWLSLGATGTHLIDLTQWLVQPVCGKVQRLQALCTPGASTENDETALVTLQFTDGLRAHVVSSVAFRAPRTLDIFGTKGSITCLDTFGPKGAGTITVNGQPLEFPVVNPYQAELADFFNAIQDDRAPEVDGNAGLTNVTLLDSATPTIFMERVGDAPI